MSSSVGNTATDTQRPAAGLRRFRESDSGYRWEDVPLKEYKHDGTHFRDITRQTLFSEDNDQPCELRYFEIKPNGHSTFERHDHTHAIVILRGRGRAIIGDRVTDVSAFDLLQVPPQTWHQLQAHEDAALGFLCQVPCDRDRPTRPSDDERRAFLRDPNIGNIVKL